MTTETELITAFSNLSVDARAVLAGLVSYGTGSGNVTITLANGLSFTVPSLEAQILANAAQQTADRLAFHKDFGGAVASMAVTRDPVTQDITGVAATFASGWSMTQAYTVDSFGKLTDVGVVMKDDQNATQATFNKAVTYDANGNFAAIG